jgi:hypothetical protein
MIVENDVRLLRRFLIARHYKNVDAMRWLQDYLKERGFGYVIPALDKLADFENYLTGMPANEAFLARRWGFVILPTYNDVIFLNSKWENPRTLYVRLVEPISELGEFGEINWYPEPDEEKWRNRAKKNHQEYIEFYEAGQPVRKKSWKEKLINSLLGR